MMLSFPEFRDRLIDNFSIYLGDFLKSDITTRIISEMDAEIQDEIGPTYAAYKDFEQQYGIWRKYEAFDSIKDPYDHYKASIEHIKYFWTARPQIIYQQLAEFFNLGYVFGLNIDSEGSNVKLNDVSLTEDKFEGCYFSNRSLKISTNEEKKGWEMTIYYNDGDSCVVSMENSSVNINFCDYQKGNKDIKNVLISKFDITTPVDDTTTDVNTKNAIIYNLKGQRMNTTDQHGMFLIKGTKVKKIIK